MALDNAQVVLACGTPLEVLIDQVAEHYTPMEGAHQASCAYCRAALVALGEAWGEVLAFARQPVPVPAGLTERIMSRVRALIARIGDSVVLLGGRGDTRVSERVIGRVARAAALTVPGVVLPSAMRIVVDPSDRSRVLLGLRLVIAFGPSIDTVARRVRAQVSAHVSAQTGARVAGVDIAIEDIVGET
ncbi:MAG: Asp23/Gls24 family envelope stress response protein [Actinomycetota bacterium]|nr:Asp23/Gls24 family envelope stress response protein [Actinomycetota bacterium]